MARMAGSVCCFSIFVKQNHHSQQAWFPELPLMTMSEQKHAQLLLTPGKHTQPRRHGSMMDIEKVQGGSQSLPPPPPPNLP